MKSFHLHREPKPVPPLVSPNYSAEECVRLRKAFRPLAAEYRRYSLVGGACLIGFFAGAVLLDPAPTFAAILLTASITVGFAVTLMMPKLICPGCQQNLNSGPGSFCPKCASAALQPGTWSSHTQCGLCGHLADFRPRKHLKIHACTHCGLFLDEKGI